MVKKRKIPLRKCIVTNEMKPKKELIRVVRNKKGEVFIDPTGKQNGRGAYLTMDFDTIEKARTTGVLERQFNTSIDSSIYEELQALLKEQRKDD